MINIEDLYSMSRDLAESEWAKKPASLVEITFWLAVLAAIYIEFLYLTYR